MNVTHFLILSLLKWRTVPAAPSGQCGVSERISVVLVWKRFAASRHEFKRGYRAGRRFNPRGCHRFARDRRKSHPDECYRCKDADCLAHHDLPSELLTSA